MEETRQHVAQGAMLMGCSLSPGYGSGTVFIYHAGVAPVVVRRTIERTESDHERRRFRQAVAAARRELDEVRERVLEEIGEAESEIIGAHLLLLEDVEFTARIDFVDGERGEVLIDPDASQAAVFTRTRTDYDRDLLRVPEEDDTTEQPARSALDVCTDVALQRGSFAQRSLLSDANADPDAAFEQPGNRNSASVE